MTKLEKKYEELVVYLKALTISHSPDEEYENRLLCEIAIFKEQQESKEHKVYNLVKEITAEGQRGLSKSGKHAILHGKHFKK